MPEPERDTYRWWDRYTSLRWWWVPALAAIIVGLWWPAWTVRVVNIVPRNLGAEGFPNPEPTLAVLPLNANQMVASAMMLGSEGIECGPLEGGVVRSLDRGKTWRLLCGLPLLGDAADNVPDWAGDHSFDVNGAASKVYAAYLTPVWELRARVVESKIGGLLPETVIANLKEVDQPQIDANHGAAADDYSISASVGEGTSGCASDGVRDAVVYTGTGTSGASPTCFQDRAAASEIPAVRSAWHESGTVYAVFYLPVDWANQLTDVVVVKGTRDALGTVTFDALKDVPEVNSGDKCTSRDGAIGFRVARCVTFPWYPNGGHDSDFGQERRTLSHLAIAVDPNDANVVYVAWGDSVVHGPSPLLLHVRASYDGGATWDAGDRLVARNATNPALAINEAGQIGFAFQQLAMRAGEQWWDTKFVLAQRNFVDPITMVLAETHAGDPKSEVMPYLGDYMDLVSVGDEFFGVFSASNDFDNSVFPHGVAYTRKAPGTPIMLGYGATVPISIDPYFYAIERKTKFAKIRTWLQTLVP